MIEGIQMTDDLKRLIPKLVTWYNERTKPWFSLSGAAGTGKTTSIRIFLDEMGFDLNSIICAAYVGKAVTVLASHGLPAKTIHSLIYKTKIVNEKDENGEIIKDEFGNPKTKMIFELRDHLEYDYKLIVIDEASMVNNELMAQILSFGIPVIFMGDKNQLPPIFGESTAMLHPDFTLTQIMRQERDNPIIELSQRVIHGLPLLPGTYGTSKIVTEIALDWDIINQYDVILTAKNSTREYVNNIIRRNILDIPGDYPTLGEKIICRQNNWNISLGGGFSLTNGTAGTIEEIYEETITKQKMLIDFKPDFTGQTVHRIAMDRHYITLPYEQRKNESISKFNKFEYGYAITVHLSQGSQYNRVLYLDEFFHSAEDTKKMRYTAITRAIDNITIVICGARSKKY